MLAGKAKGSLFREFTAELFKLGVAADDDGRRGSWRIAKGKTLCLSLDGKVYYIPFHSYKV